MSCLGKAHAILCFTSGASQMRVDGLDQWRWVPYLLTSHW
jgi:hypothetical protein